MATSSPKKLPRVRPVRYTTCLLYNTKEALEKLQGLSLASCNPAIDKLRAEETPTPASSDISVIPSVPDLTSLVVSDVMSCNYCSAVFTNRLDQKRHYRSDWHRYNLKQRLKSKEAVSEDQFAEISGNISSLSGSDSDNDTESDLDPVTSEPRLQRRLAAARSRILPSTSSTDSESDTGSQSEDAARRLPKVYFRNHEGQILSMYRCVLHHKKRQPVRGEDLIQQAQAAPTHSQWAVFMTGGGHFAGAIFNKEKLIAHKTFHRYVVRAKRGTAQSSRDSQGNAPKSAGASLRRYNEAALQQDIQDLIASWGDHIKDCDKIFLRAPSFNRKIFFGGKNPPLQKDDVRIRLIPFQTRRPTFNEVRRVYELLASIECYGDEADLQDLIPITPPQVFNPDTGQLTPLDEASLSPRQRKLINRKLNRASPLIGQDSQSAAGDEQSGSEGQPVNVGGEGQTVSTLVALPGHVLQPEHHSSGTSTCSDTELVETMETIDLLELKAHGYTKKPKRKKKSSKIRSGSLRCQNEPESNVLEEERYHLKNSLYTACKIGDLSSLQNLLAVFCTQPTNDSSEQSPVNGKADNENAANGQNPPNQLTDTTNSAGVEKSETETGYSKHGDASELSTNAPNISFDRMVNNLPNLTCAGFTERNHPMSKPTLTVHVHSSSVEPGSKAAVHVVNSGNIGNRTDSEENTIGDDSKRTTISQKSKDLIFENPDIVAQNLEGKMLSSSAENETVSKDIANTKSKAERGGILCDHSNDECEVETGRESNADERSAVKGKEDKSSMKLSQLPLLNTSASLPDMSPVVTSAILNEVFGDSSTTLLHVAAREGHRGIVTLLMVSGADPSIRDRQGLTPYLAAKDKGTRNEFRKFMATWPDRYNYIAAQIPAPLTEEMEIERKKKEAEKKKAQKKAKQERQKAQREEEAKKEAEEREKQRYLKLSDREKRALAAEKRLLNQVTSTGGPAPIFVRCFQCGADMTGKVPFQYFDNKFCTSKCLQAHRKSQPQS